MQPGKSSYKFSKIYLLSTEKDIFYYMAVQKKAPTKPEII